MKKINTAVIGFGAAAKAFHLASIVKNSDYLVTMVMTRSESNQKQLKEMYPDVTLITSFEEAINDKNIELIVIATANDVHYEYTKKALLNKKHVVCEKPFVKTYKEAKELFDLAKENNVVLKVFQNRKYDGELLTMKELLKTKDFGTPVSFVSRFDRFNPNIGVNWRYKENDMAGIFYDLAPHLVHHSIELFGLPNSVSNNLYITRPNATVDDHFEMILNYDNSFTVRLGAEMYNREERPKMEYVGTNGSYIKYGFDHTDNLLERTDNKYQTTQGRAVYIDNNLNKEDIKVLLGNHYVFYENMAYEINNNILDSVDNMLAMKVILTMEKAIESNKEQRTINIPTI